jgi:hypothetical protein
MIEIGKVTAKRGLHLRAKPDDQSEILANVPVDTIVDIDGREGNWLRSTYNFKRGYLYKDYVEVLSLPEPQPPSRHVVTIWALLGVIVAAGIAFMYGILGWKP